MQQTIYCFSGLCADDRLFSRLQLQGFTLKHIQWLPAKDNCTLPEYAWQLSAQIKEANPLLLGVSFGGMLAIEAAKKLQAKHTFIVSSVTTANQFPQYYHWANQMNLLDTISLKPFVRPGRLSHFLFGAHTQEEKHLVDDYIKRADTAYIKWALKAIINWKHSELLTKVTHIHGNKDHVIPIPRKVDFVINKGGHLMICNRADEIAQIISKVLSP